MIAKRFMLNFVGVSPRNITVLMKKAAENISSGLSASQWFGRFGPAELHDRERAQGRDEGLASPGLAERDR
jgi:hypothetical protein